MLTSPSTASSRIPPVPAAAIATDAGVLMQASRRTRMRLGRGRRYRPPMGTMWGAEECLKRVQIACVETTRNTGWFACDLLLDFTQSTWIGRQVTVVGCNSQRTGLFLTRIPVVWHIKARTALHQLLTPTMGLFVYQPSHVSTVRSSSNLQNPNLQKTRPTLTTPAFV